MRNIIYLPICLIYETDLIINRLTFVFLKMNKFIEKYLVM